MKPISTTSTGFFTKKWPVFYEDNHLLSLYKPSGLLVQADQTGDPSLLALSKAWLKKKYNKPGRVFLGLVHRLDRPVAGVVLFAKTSKAAGRLSGQFRSGTAEKIYTAVVEGVLRQPSGRLTHPIERLNGGSSRIPDAATGKSREARLEFEVTGTGAGRSLLHIRLETGRHHQIRAQLAYIGHPVLGDIRYGASAPLAEKQIALCATELSVIHPTARDTRTFSSPLPAGWPWPGLEKTAQAPPWNWTQIREEIDGFAPENT
ncbi:MAG: RNA pseudouridine synthase [Desulfosalsimonadaceae bacterium]